MPSALLIMNGSPFLLLTEQLCLSELIRHLSNANLREKAVYALLQACRMRANQATNLLAIGKEHKGGHALDADFHGCLQVLIGIHACKTQLTCVGLAQFLEDGCQRAAGWAPGGCEIDNHR